MHVISHVKIVRAQAAHPECSTALDQWYRLTKRVRWANFAEVKACFAAVDKGNRPPQHIYSAAPH